MSSGFVLKRKPTNPHITQEEPFYISGEIYTNSKAAEKLGMKRDTFYRIRKRVTKKLAKGEALTWEHFTK